MVQDGRGGCKCVGALLEGRVLVEIAPQATAGTTGTRRLDTPNTPRDLSCFEVSVRSRLFVSKSDLTFRMSRTVLVPEVL